MSTERSNNKREGGEERKRIVRKKADGQDSREQRSERPKRVYTSEDSERAAKPRKSFDDKKSSRFSDERPAKKFDRNDADKKGYSRNNDDRPKRSFDKSEREDRPKRSFGDREDRQERPRGSFDKNEGREERPKRSFGKKDDGDRSERPRRSFDNNEGREERPKRSFGKRDDSDRNERPKRSFDKSDNREDRPKRSFNRDDRRDDKPKRSFGPDTVKKNAAIEKAKRAGHGRPDAFFGKTERPAKQKWEDEEKDFKRKDTREKDRKTERPEKEAPAVATRKDEVMPLNKFVAHCGVASRREAADIIKEGKVKVNGEVKLEPGYKVQLDDKVEYDGKIITSQKNLVYILLNKPKNYLTTTDDPQERKTVMELIEDAGDERVYPVGRLDRNTSGLLLLTNDGELAQKLSHPKYNIRKIYQVTLDKALTKAHFDQIVNGLTLEDGEIKVDDLAYLEKKNEIGIEIHSGRNRIVRRIFEHLGYQVEKLDRVTYAGLTKKNIPRGKWRFLNAQEVINLKYYK